jgi:hypothetical protein
MLRADPDTDHLCNVAIASRDKFLETTQFLLSRPDLTRSLRSLTIQDRWSNQSIDGTLIQDFDVLSIHDFYAAIHNDLKKILEAALNLSIVTFICTEVVPEFLQITSRIATLHTINFHLCKLDHQVCESITTNQIESSETLLNLRLLMTNVAVDTFGVWHTLALCPRIRTLSVLGSGYTDISIPPDIVRQTCNPFTTLERVFLDHFDPDDISALSVWMSEASGSLRLTHFKIHTRWGMDDTVVFDLLNALRWSPNMQVLVLEGLRDAGLELIDRISQACPNLFGLTLIRRHNNRQSETKLASWPHASYEYASHFTSFTQLNHFGWNLDVDLYGLDPSPSVMSEFEAGFPDLLFESWEETEMRDQNAYFDDTHLMAGSFAAHCPTLRTFAIVDRMVRLVCLIDNTPSGRLLSKQKYSAMFESTKWNPHPWKGWPLIMPTPIGTVRE